MKRLGELMMIVAMLRLVLLSAGCNDREVHYHYHGESRWSDDCGGCEQRYDGYNDRWIPAEEWRTYDLEGWGYQPPSGGGSGQHYPGDGGGGQAQSNIFFDNDTSSPWTVRVDGYEYVVPPGGTKDVPASGTATVQYMVNGYWTGPGGQVGAGSYRLWTDGAGLQQVN